MLHDWRNLCQKGFRFTCFTGFSTNSGNFGAEGVKLNIGNKVDLVSEYDTVKCDVDDAASHQERIVCIVG